ncbi:MAG: methenyltetrahydromethanopterin cyclohydrolase [Anaerolineales bacterium]|nr:methenyltetrahydromethanopterin cyclohydrolase [Anaerolineales bacterium]
MPKSLNEAAMEIISPLLDDPARYGAFLSRSADGATLVDLGLAAPGGWLAAKLWVEAAHGGMAVFNYGRMRIKDLEVPTAEVIMDDPMLSVIACESGAWKLGEGEFVPIGSGPARAKARADRFSQRVEYSDPSPNVVLQLQMNRMPGDETLQFVANACAIPVSGLVVMVAPSASLVGGVQVASRSFEQAIISLGRNTDFDITSIVYGYGRAPIPPVIKDEVLAMGRINDALVYGGSSGLWVSHPNDEAVRQTALNLPFSAQAGPDYGKGYAEIYNTYGRSLFNIPARLDSPAHVTMTNIRTGTVTTAGRVDEDVLFRSFTQTTVS